MLTASKRMSAIGDKDTFWVLTLEVAGARFYFGDESRHITNRYGAPTVLLVRGANLVDAFSKGFDIASDLTTDTSVSISDLKIPLDLATLFRAGENMVGNRAELALLQVGQDYSQRWVQASGTVENPTLLSVDAVDNTLSFSFNQEDRVQYDFPTKHYLVQPGWIDDVTAAADPEAAFGLDPDDIQLVDIDWGALNFLFSTADVVLKIPDSYTDTQQYVPFVFGKPGISGGDTDVELWKDLDGDGVIDTGAAFSVGVDERLRYFTTHGQLVAALMLQGTSISDPDVDNTDGGTKLIDVLDDLDGGSSIFPAGGSCSVFGDTHADSVQDLYTAATYVFAHQDVCLWARVAIHAGKAKQVGTPIYMVDRKNYGTPYSRSGSYTPALGFTKRARPYTYVDIKADYSSFLELINPQDSTDNTKQVYVVLAGSTSVFHCLDEDWSGAGFNEGDATAAWAYFYACWVTAIRAGANTAQVLEAFFGNAEIQRITNAVFASGGRIYQDVWLSCFNTAMASRYVIKYPTADPLDTHCPANWTEGGQVFLDGAVIENPAELVMHMAEVTGLAYDKGALFELRDCFRNWKIGGFIDDLTDVVDYVTGVLQTYLPFTIAKSAGGITGTFWNWEASKTHAVHHFVEGIDLEVVGDGLVIEEAGMLRSLRLSGRRVTWLHQESSPFATTKPVEDGQLTSQELKKLDRLRNNIRLVYGALSAQGHLRGTHRLAKFERQLRSTYGSWDFAQDSRVTEQQDFWRINNYTGDVEAADQGRWFENPLTFPISDNEREQWSRFMPHPLLVAAFRRYATQDREDLELALADVYDAVTLDRAASWIIAARCQPKATFQGIAKKRFGWIVEGDPVRVTSPTLGLDDQLCFVTEKAWQTTNAGFVFRPVRLPARDTDSAA